MAAAPALPTAADRWRIVLARDRRFDGTFVYAVASTGIYCKPSCPSRRPRVDNVEFYAVPEAAERAGFRACRRCKPGDVHARDPRVELVRRACRHLEQYPASADTLPTLAKRVQTTAPRLIRAFRDILGVSPRQYRDAKRLALFKTALKRRSTVSPALYEAGFSSPSRVYERADRDLGMTPATYQRGGAGLEVRFTVVASSLGRLLVAGTARGICQVKLGDAAGPLEAELREEYTDADLRRDDGPLAGWTAAIVRHLEGQEPHLDLPTDVRATAFQRRVWDALKKIPCGETRSYSQLARAVGNPKATRAVARACATNPVAIVVPCHRVIREDGALGGYRWGVERKERLLNAERGSDSPRA